MINLRVSITRRLVTSTTIQGRYNHQDAMKLPPRSSWDTLQSAARGLSSLFFDPLTRDTLVQTIDRGIINPNVLEKVDYGMWMGLALHHDLNSEYSFFKKYNFDAKEFIEGSKMAVENFQECLYSLDKKIIANIENELDMQLKRREQEKEKDEEQETLNPLKNNDLIQDIVIQQMKLKTKAQDEDEDSLEYQMKQMISTQLLTAIETQFALSVINSYLSDMMRMDYHIDSGKVLNVALMSARAHEVPPDDESDDENENKNDEKPEIMVDGSLSNDSSEEDVNPICAQIEILYTISQTFSKKRLGESFRSIAAINNNNNSDDDDANIDEESDKERTIESAWVGVFEGWLDGKETLQWKLVDNRPAWEFPVMQK